MKRRGMPDPNVMLTSGPARVAAEDPPEGWQPPPFLGFSHSTRGVDVDPLVWEGDQA